MSFRSWMKVRSGMYQMSIRTQSMNFTSARPFTCQVQSGRGLPGAAALPLLVLGYLVERGGRGPPATFALETFRSAGTRRC